MNGVFVVLRRELLARPRRGWFHLKRMAVVAFGGIIVLMGLFSANAAMGSPSGLVVFSWLAVAALVAICPIGLVAAGSSIMSEKEDRTIGLLFLSDITLGQFAAGKLLVSLFAVTVSLLSLVPMLMLAMSLGGIGAGQILASLAIIVCTAFLAVSVGLFAGAVTSSEKRMHSLLALLGLMMFVLPPPFFALLHELPRVRLPWEVLWVTSPFAAISHVLEGRLFDLAAFNCVLSIGLGLIFVLLAVTVLRARRTDLDTPSETGGILGWLRSVRPGRWFVLPPVTGNPVAWRELHVVYGGVKAAWLQYGLMVLGCCVILLLIKMEVGKEWDLVDVGKTAVVMIFILSLFVLWLVSVSRFGAAFSKEKSQRTISMLLTTDMTDSEIIRGKVTGVLRSMAPWLTSVVVFGGAIVLYLGSEVLFSRSDYSWRHFKEVVMGSSFVGAEYIAGWLCFSSLALWLSVRYKRNVALGVCVLAMVLWNTIGRTFQGMVFAAIAFGGFMYGELFPWLMLGVDIVGAGCITAVSLACLSQFFRQSALRDEA